MLSKIHPSNAGKVDLIENRIVCFCIAFLIVFRYVQCNTGLLGKLKVEKV